MAMLTKRPPSAKHNKLFNHQANRLDGIITTLAIKRIYSDVEKKIQRVNGMKTRIENEVRK